MIVAGEASGDLHGSRLIESMLRTNPELQFCGIGGPELEKCGVELLYDASKISVVGVVEVISHLAHIIRAQRILRRRLRESRPRLLILIGFLGFIGYVGTPHIGWDYQCRHATPGGAPCHSASWCEYYGFQGRRVDYPPYGETCKLVKFLPVDWELLGEDLLAWAARQWEKVQ